MRALIVAIVSAATVGTAVADDEAKAEALIEEAMIYWEAEQWAEAVARLRQAVALAPSAATFFNVGFGADKLKDCPLALAGYQAFLRNLDDQSVSEGEDRDANKAHATKRIVALSAQCEPTPERELPLVVAPKPRPEVEVIVGKKPTRKPARRPPVKLRSPSLAPLAVAAGMTAVLGVATARSEGSTGTVLGWSTFVSATTAVVLLIRQVALWNSIAVAPSPNGGVAASAAFRF